MVEVNASVVHMVMNAVRVKSETAAEEIEALIYSCISELQIAGVWITDFDDPLAFQAVKLYCKARYGYDEQSERYWIAYAALRDSMALSGNYARI